MRKLWLAAFLAFIGAGYFWIQNAAQSEKTFRFAATAQSTGENAPSSPVQRALRPSGRSLKDILEAENEAKKRKIIQNLVQKRKNSNLRLFKPTQETIHAALSQDGLWMEDETYGEIWYPTRVDPEWRPFTHGRWVFSSEGWLWEGKEEWAWLTFHYGHWVLNVPHGWGWIPDDVWSPANVAWRANNHLVAWAPLAPDTDNPAEIRKRSWVGVAVDRLMESDLSPYIIPPDELAPFVAQMKVLASSRRYHENRLYIGPSLENVLEWSVRLPPPVDSLAWRMQNPVRYAKHLSRGQKEGWFTQSGTGGTSSE